MAWSTFDSFSSTLWVLGSTQFFPTTTKAPLTDAALIPTTDLTTGGRNISTVNMTKTEVPLIYATLIRRNFDTTSTADLTTGGRNMSTVNMTKSGAPLIDTTLIPTNFDTTSTAELTTGGRNVSTITMTTTVETQTTLHNNIAEPATKESTLKEPTILELTTVDESDSTDLTVTTDSRDGRPNTENSSSGEEAVVVPEAITFTLVLLTLPIIY